MDRLQLQSLKTSPRYDENDDQKIEHVGLENPGLVLVIIHHADERCADVPILHLAVHLKQQCRKATNNIWNVDIRYIYIIIYTIRQYLQTLTQTMAVGRESMTARSQTRMVTFLAWEVVQRYCAFMGCTTAQYLQQLPVCTLLIFNNFLVQNLILSENHPFIKIEQKITKQEVALQTFHRIMNQTFSIHTLSEFH